MAYRNILERSKWQNNHSEKNIREEKGDIVAIYIYYFPLVNHMSFMYLVKKNFRCVYVSSEDIFFCFFFFKHIKIIVITPI